MDPIALTSDQFDALATRVGEAAGAAALKAINTVSDDDRPAAAKAAPAVVKSRRIFPRLSLAVKGMVTGKWDRAGYEREISKAARELWYTDADGVAPNAVIWPKSLTEAQALFEYMGEKESLQAAEHISAVRAMTESLTTTLSGGTAGGLLVPPEFRQDMFVEALSPRVALRRVPGVTTLQVTGVDLRFPRESVRAGASQAAEAGTISSADATLASQAVRIEKQYAMRRFSSEWFADANPAAGPFINRTVVRDLAIQQDIQYLRGTGVSPQVTGMLSLSGTTSPPSLGANGRTPTWDDILEVIYLLEAADVPNVDFCICHPRPIFTLSREKDGEGRYLATSDGVARLQFGADAMLLNQVPAYKTTNLTITQTVGGSTDCTTMIFGDSSQVFILERGGVELMTSEHLYFTTDEIAVRVIARSAPVVLQPASIELLVGVRA